jgi:hypothetical protein
VLLLCADATLQLTVIAERHVSLSGPGNTVVDGASNSGSEPVKHSVYNTEFTNRVPFRCTSANRSSHTTLVQMLGEVPAAVPGADAERRDLDSSLSVSASLEYPEPVAAGTDGEVAQEVVTRTSAGDGDRDAPTTDGPAPTTSHHSPAADESSTLGKEVELWPATAGRALAGLPKGRKRRFDSLGRTYYLDHRTLATIWERPPGALETPPNSTPSSVTSQVEVTAAQQYSSAQTQYLARVRDGLALDVVRWLPRERMTRCRIIFIEAPRTNLGLLETMLFLKYQLQTSHNIVCIVEDISEPWIAEVGVYLNLPVTFIKEHLDWPPELSLYRA